jgi:hypothetical protein
LRKGGEDRDQGRGEWVRISDWFRSGRKVLSKKSE